MSDARLRELERRWRREASLGVFCEFAAACARAGLRAPPADEADGWAPRRLSVAARLGDPDARRALGLRDVAEPDDVFAWVKRLSRGHADAPTAEQPWERELFARAGAAAARPTLALVDGAAADALRSMLAALDDWAAAGASLEDRQRVTDVARASEVELVVRRLAARLEAERTARREEPRALLAVGCACAVASSAGPAPVSAANAALHASSALDVPTVVAAVRNELLPWVLFVRG